MDTVKDSNGVDCIRVQPSTAKEILGYTQNPFYEDAAKHNWEKQDGPRGRKYYLVPLAFYQLRQNIAEQERRMSPVQSTLPLNESKPRVDTTQNNNKNESDSPGSSEMVRGYEMAIESYKDQIELLREELKQSRTQYDSQTRQLEAAQNAIIRIKDPLLTKETASVNKKRWFWPF